MFGLGDTELILILIFAFLLFGPDKLPSMGRTIGRGIKQFRQASDSVTKVVKTEVLNPLNEAAQAEAGAPKATASGGTAVAEPLQQQERSTETFAERRARLAREREEREAAAAATAAEAAIEADAIGGPGSDGVNAAETTVTADEAATPDDAEVPAELEEPATAATVASMWAIDEEPEATLAPAPEPEPERVLAATGKEDASVPTA